MLSSAVASASGTGKMSSWLGLAFRGTKSGESTGPLPIEGLKRFECAEAAVGICQSKSVVKIDIARVSRVIFREARVVSLFERAFYAASPFQMP